MNSPNSEIRKPWWRRLNIFKRSRTTKRNCPKNPADLLDFQVVSPISVDEFIDMLKEKGEIKVTMGPESPLGDTKLPAVKPITIDEYLEMLKSQVEIKGCTKVPKTDAAVESGTVVNEHKDCERYKQLDEFRTEVRQLMMLAHVNKN
jgi:hypothetical protein